MGIEEYLTCLSATNGGMANAYWKRCCPGEESSKRTVEDLGRPPHLSPRARLSGEDFHASDLARS